MPLISHTPTVMHEFTHMYLGEIKGIISGQIVYNHIACNNEQIRHFQTTKTENRWTVFQSVENTSKPGLYALHLPRC